MNKRSELLKLIDADPLGLLKVSESKSKLKNEDSVLVSLFEEIQEFVSENEKEPGANTENILEFKLYSRLRAIRSDARKVKKLLKYDFGGLFKGSEIKEITVDDIIADDPYNLLSVDNESDIFKLEHVKATDRIKPDYLSRRKVCQDFYLYKDMFNVIHEDLANKSRKLVRYSSNDLQIGKFYALDGIILFLDSIDGNKNTYTFSSGERERFDGRTLCIFDNGTQSDMLFRSLDKALQLDGYSIGEHVQLEPQISASETTNDILNGYIYVLKTHNSKVVDITDLYKIGFTTGSVAKRIVNARKEATYLFSDVDVVATFRCFNIKTYELEQNIHQFFSALRLDIELLDNSNNTYRPREWFRVDYTIIEEAIQLILENQIAYYEYDPRVNQIVRKSAVPGTDLDIFEK